jgi:hypothetical protein
MIRKYFYAALLILNTLVAIFFLGLIKLASYSVSDESINSLSESQIFIRQISYGLFISIFFSFMSVVISWIYKKAMLFQRKHLYQIFKLQFVILFSLYAFILIFIYARV